MKDFMKSHGKQIIIFLVITVIIVPLCINLAFKLHAPTAIFEATWNAGEFLQFYGTILGSILAVYGVFKTIQYTQDNYRKDFVNRVLPYMALTNLEKESKFNWFTSTCEPPDEQDSISEYREYKLNKIFFIISDGKISVMNKLDKRQITLVHNRGSLDIPDSNGRVYMVDYNLISIPLIIENVGNGAAIAFRVGLNRKDTDERNRKYIVPQNLKRGEKFYVHLYSENPQNTQLSCGDYILEIHYEDIYGNKYKQCYGFYIRYNTAMQYLEASLECVGKQENEERNAKNG
jgi:hypothetical protein